MFRKFALTGLLAAALGTGAQAADVAAPPAIAAPAPWAFDFAFGGKLMSDYNFRGISQSARGPSVNVYGDCALRLALWRRRLLDHQAADPPGRRDRHLRRYPPGHRAT